MDDNIPLLSSYDDPDSISYLLEHRGTNRHGLFGDDILFPGLHGRSWPNTTTPLSRQQMSFESSRLDTGPRNTSSFDHQDGRRQPPAALSNMIDSTEEHQSQLTDVPQISPNAIRNGPRPHRCNVCSQWFTSADTLERHAKATCHRIYACNYDGCTKSYFRRDVFVRHKATHREHNSHQCQSCRENGDIKTYSRKDHLIQHQRNCHSDLFGSFGTPSAASGTVTPDFSPASFSPLDGIPIAGANFDLLGRSLHKHVSSSSRQSFRTSLGSSSLASMTGSLRSVEQDCPVTRLHHALVDVLGLQSHHLHAYRQLLGLCGKPDLQQTALGLQQLVAHMLPNNNSSIRMEHNTRRPTNDDKTLDDAETYPLPFEVF